MSQDSTVRRHYQHVNIHPVKSATTSLPPSIMTKDAQIMTKSAEASASSQAHHEHQAPPSYTPDTSQPPSYDSIVAEARANMNSLAVGDPSETISVPMVSSIHDKNIHDLNPFSRKTGKTRTTVTARKMTRDFYLKHYVKDADGKFVGTSSQAPDGSLVFVPGKSTPEDLMKQVQEVAFRTYSTRGAGMGDMGSVMMGGAAGGFGC
jgi:hypothetical protein